MKPLLAILALSLSGCAAFRQTVKSASLAYISPDGSEVKGELVFRKVKKHPSK